MSRLFVVSLLFVFVLDSFAQNTVESIYELGKCIDSRKGEIVYVSDEQREYICFGRWIAEEKNANQNKSSFEREPSLNKNQGSVMESVLNNIKYGELLDERDGRKYKTLTIGKQVWMAENLSYKTEKSHCIDAVGDNNCSLYGALYDWRDAMVLPTVMWDVSKKINTTHRGVCPIGFHIPKVEEWSELFTLIRQNNVHEIAKGLKSSTGWQKGVPGNDIIGFSVLPSGFLNHWGRFKNQGVMAYFWTATLPQGEQRPVTVIISHKSNEPIFDYKAGKSGNEFSVRCLKDSD